jgi:hypothetical protein
MNIVLAKIAATGALVATLVTTALPLTASAGELHNRFVNQQRRIAEGIDSGRLTWGEYRADEARLQSIEAQRAALARAQGGWLSAGERAQFNAELNGESNRIFWTKHNARWGY